MSRRPAAKTARKPTNGNRPAVERPAKAFKIVAQPVFVIHNEKGQVVQEITPPISLTIYEPEFGNLRSTMEDMAKKLPEIEAEIAAKQNA